MAGVEIPVVDLNARGAAADLLNAAMDYGFVFVKHEDVGLDPQHVASMFELSRELFAAPESVKAGCSVNSDTARKDCGWISMHAETLDPGKQKAHVESIGKFHDDCYSLCKTILDLFATALEIPDAAGGRTWFSTRHDRSRGSTSSVLRLLYSQWPEISNMTFARAPTVITAASTLLFRLPSQPGLEIKTRSGAWAPVPVDPEPSSRSKHLPILVNIGDLLSFWTNGLLKSTVHRVVFPNAADQASEDRYSIAFFCHPEEATELVEIPSERVRAHGQGKALASQHSSMTAQDYLHSRLAATYLAKA